MFKLCTIANSNYKQLAWDSHDCRGHFSLLWTSPRNETKDWYGPCLFFLNLRTAMWVRKLKRSMDTAMQPNAMETHCHGVPAWMGPTV